MKNIYSIKHKKDAQDFFLEKFWSIDSFYKIEKSPYTLFGYKDNGKTWLWEINYDSKYIWINFYQIWRFLREDYNMKRTNIQQLILSVLGEPFKIEGFTQPIVSSPHFREMGEPFKIEGFTPPVNDSNATPWLGEPFKIEGFTPTFSGTSTCIALGEPFKVEDLTTISEVPSIFPNSKYIR